MKSVCRIGSTAAGTITGRVGLLGLALFLATIALPSAAGAVNTCNGLFTIDYVAGPAFALPGDTLRVRLTFGTASISGGTMLNLNRVRFDLDCNDNFALGVPCTDEGLQVEYEGDGTITTTCGVGWNTGHAVSANPNEVVFTPTVPVAIPANIAVPPGFCALEFDVKVLAYSVDNTPSDIQETTGYLASQGDAMCNNGLASSGTQSTSIPLCPNCDDGADCTTDMCDQDTGQCFHTILPDSTPCGDTDGNACTFAGCNGTLDSSPAGALLDGCDQHHMVTVCPPDGNPCTDDAGCNPGTGLCDYPPTPDSTPCPDTDQDSCTTAGCDGQGMCDQMHIVCVTTTTSTTTSTTTTTAPCVPVPEICNNMIDDDCDGLVDCADPDCDNVPPCPVARKDPTLIKFARPGSLDLIKGHATLDTTPLDVRATSVGVLLSNPSGVIYQAALPGSALTPDGSGKTFRYRNSGARTAGGIYSLKVKLRHNDSYSFSFASYANLSAATDPRMRLQFYIGGTPKPFITTNAPWTSTGNGWRAPKDH
jgi:hypothetical protein